MYMIKENFLAFLAHKESEFITKTGTNPKLVILTENYFNQLEKEFEDLYGKYESNTEGNFFKGLPIFQTVKNNVIEFY